MAGEEAEHTRTVDVKRLGDEQFRLLVDSVQDYAIFVLDPEGYIRSWNTGAVRVKGYTADEIIGRHFSVFYTPEDLAVDKPARELVEARATGRVEDEGWRVRKDGSRFWANVVITALHDPAGQLFGFAKVTRDLTERRQAEQDRLRRVHAEEAVRLRDEFMSIASHELRTPLATLRIRVDGVARMLGRGRDLLSFDLLATRFGTLRNQVDRLEGLVEELLDVSRIASGRLPLRLEPLDLTVLVREAVEHLDEVARKASGTVILRADAAVPGRWDRPRIEQMLANLLGNAVKYGRGRPVEVTVTVEGDRARLVVRDEGIGIAPGAHARIFERFERAVDDRHFGGLGLGLWISRQVVEAHGGAIRVESEPGVGSTFTVDLPRGES